MNALKKLLSKARRPRLSFVVVVHDMAEQAGKTLQSLTPPYQRDVDAADYEIVVLENSSERPLGKEAATAFGENIRYYYREESLPSPVPAARFGVEKARGEILALMIDGARMASPGMVSAIIEASRLHDSAIVAVPGYHLGHIVQQEALKEGYDEAEEARLLQSIEWPDDGYRLFDIACFSRSNAAGFFRPAGESNCLCLPRRIWDAVGGYDPAFVGTGGGFANPDLYKRVCELPGIELIVTPGEGTFHQFHGGITTGTPAEERERYMAQNLAHYRALRGRIFRSPETRASLFGRIAPPAMRFMEISLERCATDDGPEGAS